MERRDDRSDGYFVALPAPARRATGSRRRERRSPDLVRLGVLAAFALVVFVLRPTSAPEPVVLVEPEPVRIVTEDGPGSYRFLAVDGRGAPVRWGACSPIRYVVNPEHARYPTWQDDLEIALSRVTAATGLAFEYVGESDEIPTEERAPSHPGRYGPDWAPVLVAWADEDQIPSLAGDVVAAARTIPAGTRPVYVSGSIYLDRAHGLSSGFGRGRAWGTVMLHEAGHLVGLGHVDDEGEVMDPGGERSRAAATVRWGPGDTVGLRTLGLEAGCQTVPEPPVG